MAQPFTKFQYFDGDSAAGIHALFDTLTGVFKLAKTEIDAPAIAARVAELDAELSEGASLTEAGGRLRDKLKVMVGKFPFVRISPTIPKFAEMDDFEIHELQDDVVVFWKSGSSYSVQVPYSRIAEILPATWPERPTIILNGRLQWITATGTWKYLPDSPLDDYGVPKPASRHDAAAANLMRQLQQNYGTQWASLSTVSAFEPRDGSGLLYDIDGKYFRYESRDGKVLVVIAKRLRES